jgi:hypothetical protein
MGKRKQSVKLKFMYNNANIMVIHTGIDSTRTKKYQSNTALLSQQRDSVEGKTW